MLTRLFVGAKYSTESNLSQKISGFKKRFDPKFHSHLMPHISLIAPFEINCEDKEALMDYLQEEMESFFFGENGRPKIDLQGVGIHQAHKKNILYLNPSFSDNMFHCMESVQDICESFIPRGVRYKKNAKQFLPLGSFNENQELEDVMNQVKEEFYSNSQLSVTGISLFEKKFGLWSEVIELIGFKSDEKELLKVNHF